MDNFPTVCYRLPLQTSSTGQDPVHLDLFKRQARILSQKVHQIIYTRGRQHLRGGDLPGQDQRSVVGRVMDNEESIL